MNGVHCDNCGELMGSHVCATAGGNLLCPRCFGMFLKLWVARWCR